MKIFMVKTAHYCLFSFLLTIIFLMSQSLFALGQCEYRIERVEQADPSAALLYDVFSRDGLVKRFNIEVRRVDESEEQCALQLRVRSEGATRMKNSISQELNYRLALVIEQTQLQDGSVLMQFHDVAYYELIKFAYQILISGEQFVAPGIYQDTLLLELFDKNNGDVLLERRRMVVSAEVESAARVSFAGTLGREQSVDFGELVDGKKISPAPLVVIQSTGNYGLSFSSEHKGVLRHQGNKEKWDIPYRASLGGRVIDLRQEKAVLKTIEPTKSSGLYLPLSLEVPVVGDKPPGTYSDVIHVVITPLEILF